MSDLTKELDLHAHVRCTDAELEEAAVAVMNAKNQNLGSLIDLQAAIELLGKEAGVSSVPLINELDCKNLPGIIGVAETYIGEACRRRGIVDFHQKMESNLRSKGEPGQKTKI